MKSLPLSALLQADLQIVDRIVRQRIQSQPVVAEVLNRRTLTSEPVRLWAALALLSAQCGSYNIERVQHVASTVELIATAARVHDELIDQAERRRGAASIRSTWQQGVPLMTGDYLYALAAGEMALVPDPRVITYYSEAVKQISEGTLSLVTVVRPFAEAERQYLFQAEGRTAALFAAACMAGSVASGCSETQVAALGQYGRALGLAYQINRDVEDYRNSSAPANGSGGSHALREGLITLPLIYAVDATNDDKLAAIIDQQPAEPDVIAWALTQVRDHGLAPAIAAAQRYRDEAVVALQPFGDTNARQALSDFALALVP